jgi:hypothetical protein
MAQATQWAWDAGLSIRIELNARRAERGLLQPSFGSIKSKQAPAAEASGRRKVAFFGATSHAWEDVSV